MKGKTPHISTRKVARTENMGTNSEGKHGADGRHEEIVCDVALLGEARTFCSWVEPKALDFLLRVFVSLPWRPYYVRSPPPLHDDSTRCAVERPCLYIGTRVSGLVCKDGPLRGSEACAVGCAIS